MFAAFQGLSWSMSRQGILDPRSEQARQRRLRARTRFRVEALEPRWLLSTMGSDYGEFDPAPAQEFVMASARYGPDALTVQVASLDDWASAQLLPDAVTVRVKGDPSPGSRPDLLEIHVQPETATIYFTLRSAWEGQPVAETLQIFDSNLKESQSFAPSPQTQCFTFSLPVWSQTSSSWFVKIALPETAGGFESPESWDRPALGSYAYILEVSRRPFAPEGGFPTDGWGGGGGDYGAPAESDGTTEVDLPPSSPGSGDPTSGTPAPPVGPEPAPENPSPDPGSVTILLPVAVGPLPLRSTAPLGGVLASPGSVPTVDRHEGARADLAMFDPDRALEEVDFDPRQVVPVAETEVVPILALRGPGGLPILATALIAGTIQAAQADSPDPAEAEAEATANTSANVSVAAPIPTVFTAAEQTSSPSSPTGARSESCGSTARRRRASVVPGLALAFALGASLVLPDLVAALQFTIPSRPSLRLRWIRRALRSQ